MVPGELSLRPLYDAEGRFQLWKLSVISPGHAENLGPEPLGSKRKFWARIQGEEKPWLCKFAREGSGEHWAEKLGYEIAGLLGLPAARVELAVLDEQSCVLVESIIPFRAEESPDRPTPCGELIHGNEILGGYIENYERGKQRGQKQHTFVNIREAIRCAVPEDLFPKVMHDFAGLLVLDALIGNTDRHHENWALLRVTDGDVGIGLAPSYDHASSLGRELVDTRRTKLMNLGIANYVRKGRGAVFGQSGERHAENPIELVRWAASCHTEWFRPWIDRVHLVTPESTDKVIERVPEKVMSRAARDFCRAFLCYTVSELKGI